MVPLKSQAFCGTYEMWSRSSCWVMVRTSLPHTVSSPSVTSWKRSMSLAMVDLPEPVCPMIAVVVPRLR